MMRMSETAVLEVRKRSVGCADGYEYIRFAEG